jgi:hypothetical protein
MRKRSGLAAIFDAFSHFGKRLPRLPSFGATPDSQIATSTASS